MNRGHVYAIPDPSWVAHTFCLHVRTWEDSITLGAVNLSSEWEYYSTPAATYARLCALRLQGYHIVGSTTMQQMRAML